MEVVHRSTFVPLRRPLKAKHQCNPVDSEQNVTVQRRNSTTVLPSSRATTTNSITKRPRVGFSGQSVNDSPRRIGARDELGNTVMNPKNRITKVDIAHMFPEEVDHYPETEINSILEKTPIELKELFNVYNTPLDPNINLTERVASYADDEYGTKEESICRSVIRNIYPREARKNSVPVYIPNTQDFTQVIQAEICQNPDQECNYLQDALPYGMQSVCYQKYSYKKLLYLDSLEKRMASDLFRYPSCCSCYIKTLSIELRSADRNSSIKHINTQAQILNSSQEISSTASTSSVVDGEDDGGQQKKVSNQIKGNGSKGLQAEEKIAGSSLTTIILDSSSGNSGFSQVLSSSPSPPSARTLKEARPTAHTIISHEDKVFIPNNENRK